MLHRISVFDELRDTVTDVFSSSKQTKPLGRQVILYYHAPPQNRPDYVDKLQEFRARK